MKTLDKTAFDDIVKRRAEEKYEKALIDFRGHLVDFFKKNPNVNNHTYGNSVHIMIADFMEKTLKERKEEIVKSFAKDEVNYIISNLENIKFLFDKESVN